MYIPKVNLLTDREEIVAFMKRFSFATIISAKDNMPVATHLPFLIDIQDENIILSSHFAKANDHWQQIEDSNILVIFTEPHAYISPTNYAKELNVPTWNYISVHAYGTGKIITDVSNTFQVLESTIEYYEAAYREQWNTLPEDYKLKMSKGIVAFEVRVTDLQAKKKLSQNKSEAEQQKIIASLSKSNNGSEKLVAEYMNGILSSSK
jgi:transcriptional regulator